MAPGHPSADGPDGFAYRSDEGRGIAVFERAKADVAGAGKGLHDRGKSVPGFDLRAARVRRIYPEIRAACEAQL
jgi:hypothetical protein